MLQRSSAALETKIFQGSRTHEGPESLVRDLVHLDKEAKLCSLKGSYCRVVNANFLQRCVDHVIYLRLK